MSSTLWSAKVTHIGSDAPMMFEEGVVILFGEPVPPALADVALVHANAGHATRDITVGDAIVVGDHRYEVTALGEIANKNLAELGHIVLYINQPEQTVLPGAVLVSGPTFTAPEIGVEIRIEGA